MVNFELVLLKTIRHNIKIHLEYKSPVCQFSCTYFSVFKILKKVINGTTNIIPIFFKTIKTADLKHLQQT